jgi:hypothetical protein
VVSVVLFTSLGSWRTSVEFDAVSVEQKRAKAAMEDSETWTVDCAEEKDVGTLIFANHHKSVLISVDQCFQLSVNRGFCVGK